MRDIENVDKDNPAPGKLAVFGKFAPGFLSGELKLTILSSTVFIGCVTDENFAEEKA
jgi:hypothetical protein